MRTNNGRAMSRLSIRLFLGPAIASVRMAGCVTITQSTLIQALLLVRLCTSVSIGALIYVLVLFIMDRKAFQLPRWQTLSGYKWIRIGIMDHVPAALGAKRATIELHKIYQTLIERDARKRRGGMVQRKAAYCQESGEKSDPSRSCLVPKVGKSPVATALADCASSCILGFSPMECSCIPNLITSTHSFSPQIGAVVRNTFSTRRFALSSNASMLR